MKKKFCKHVDLDLKVYNVILAFKNITTTPKKTIPEIVHDIIISSEKYKKIKSEIQAHFNTDDEEDLKL